MLMFGVVKSTYFVVSTLYVPTAIDVVLDNAEKVGARGQVHNRLDAKRGEPEQAAVTLLKVAARQIFFDTFHRSKYKVVPSITFIVAKLVFFSLLSKFSSPFSI